MCLYNISSRLLTFPLARVYKHTSVFGAEVYPKIPRNRNKAVPEGNGPVPQYDKFGPDQPTLADIYRLFEERFDRKLNLRKSHFDQLDELIENTRETNQCLAGLEDDTRQPRLAMETDVMSKKKTRKRTEDAVADRAMSRDSSFAQVDHDAMCLISFGDDYTEPPTLPCCRDNALVDKGAEAPKPCFSLVEMRMLTAAGGLFPAVTASTATRSIFHQPPLWFCPTEDISSRTTASIQYATCSSFWKIKASETKTTQTLAFNPGS